MTVASAMRIARRVRGEKALGTEGDVIGESLERVSGEEVGAEPGDHIGPEDRQIAKSAGAPSERVV